MTATNARVDTVGITLDAAVNAFVVKRDTEVTVLVDARYVLAVNRRTDATTPATARCDREVNLDTLVVTDAVARRVLPTKKRSAAEATACEATVNALVVWRRTEGRAFAAAARYRVVDFDRRARGVATAAANLEVRRYARVSTRALTAT
jgi:hypothetical protein